MTDANRTAISFSNKNGPDGNREAYDLFRFAALAVAKESHRYTPREMLVTRDPDGEGDIIDSTDGRRAHRVYVREGLLDELGIEPGFLHVTKLTKPRIDLWPGLHDDTSEDKTPDDFPPVSDIHCRRDLRARDDQMVYCVDAFGFPERDRAEDWAYASIHREIHSESFIRSLFIQDALSAWDYTNKAIRFICRPERRATALHIGYDDKHGNRFISAAMPIEGSQCWRPADKESDESARDSTNSPV